MFTWITGLDTINRQFRAASGYLVTDQSLWARAWTAQPIGCTPALSVTKATAAAAVCG